MSELENNADRPALSALVVWRLCDGKVGHESQSQGLAEALGRRVPTEYFDLGCLSPARALRAWLCGRFPPGEALPAPDLILGAGHRTHLNLLAARRARGGRAVVLMKPTLPCACFDLCLVPEHDDPPRHGKVLPTQGALNPIRPAAAASPERGLILIGGPSEHHGWDTAAIVGKVASLVSRSPGQSWVLTSSRRTPVETTAALLDLRAPGLEVIPYERTERGWVAKRLAECGRVAATEDSVSMVFEALTAGGEVRLFTVPRKKAESRVYRAVDRLREQGLVGDIDEGWEAPGTARPGAALAEADRCAEAVLRRFELG